MRKIFKIIGWFFSIGGKYGKAKKKYEKAGWISKTFALIIMPVFLALGVAAAYGTAWLFKSISFASFKDVLFINILKIIGGLALGYIAIGITFRGFVSMIQHSIVAFVCASSKKKFVEKTEPQIEPVVKESDDDFLIDDTKPNAESADVKKEAGKSRKNSLRGFDIFYGIMSLIYAVGLIGAVVAVCMIA